MNPPPRTVAERKHRNELLLQGITAKFDEAEREFLIGKLKDVPATARQDAESELLRKLERCGGRQVKLRGWERAWIIDRANRNKVVKNSIRNSIMEKVR